MRISVLGNSDTTGRLLAAGEKPWPALIQERLDGELSESVEVDNWRFAPYRPDGVSYVLKLIDDAEPDYVVLPLAVYWCAFSTVQTGVERRFGERAGSMYSRAEAAYRNRFEKDDSGRAQKTVARSVARKVLGTAPLMTLQELIDAYATVIRELSRRENLQVIVLGEHHFSAELRAIMRGMESAIAKIREGIRPLALEHRFQWADMEPALQAGGRREEMLEADGVHMTREAHERAADMLAPLFAAGFAPA